MKKTILFFGLVAGLFTANAQTTVPSTPVALPSSATLNVNLHPIQSIMVNPVTRVVDLDYKTITNYVDGVSKEVKNHLTVMSTGGFTVMVNTLNDELTSTTDIVNSIELNDIKITSSKGANLGSLDNSITDYMSANAFLNKTGESIGSSAKAGAGMINVTYSAEGNNKYLALGNNKTMTTYTATVQYTIAPN